MRRKLALQVVSLCGSLLLYVSSATSAQPARFAGLGEHTRRISTQSEAAQTRFNQGLAFQYAFNHDEAIRQFQAGVKADPDCAALYWAIALAYGPNINAPLTDPAKARQAWAALQESRARSDQGSPVERDLIAALSTRYVAEQPEDRGPMDQAYAAAMREVWQKYPDDADVGALFAESLMDLWPWDLWSAEGEPRPDTPEILRTLETVLQQSPNHPLALHLYVHAMEASPVPEKAAAAADRLRDLQPGLGHMVHMPSHIDVRLGNWQAAIEANRKAIQADTEYRRLSPDQDFYRTYMAHNHHMLAFAAMMQGQQALATRHIHDMLAEMPEAWLEQNAPYVDGMFSMPYELHIRFGRWAEMLAEPEPAPHFPVARTVRLYARGVAFAARQDVVAARSAQQAFRQARASLPAGTMFVMNTADDVLAIADQVLEGEILYRAGETDAAIAALTEGVRREDVLRYIEPPDWIQPVRHILGATLMDAGRYAEAEQVFRADLKKHPHNGWSLHDLARSLRLQNRAEEAQLIEQQFQTAWKHADVKMSSACYCLPGKSSP